MLKKSRYIFFDNSFSMIFCYLNDHDCDPSWVQASKSVLPTNRFTQHNLSKLKSTAFEETEQYWQIYLTIAMLITRRLPLRRKLPYTELHNCDLSRQRLCHVTTGGALQWSFISCQQVAAVWHYPVSQLKCLEGFTIVSPSRLAHNQLYTVCDISNCDQGQNSGLVHVMGKLTLQRFFNFQDLFLLFINCIPLLDARSQCNITGYDQIMCPKMWLPPFVVIHTGTFLNE